MGHSYWSDDFYDRREAYRRATGASAFAYHDALRSMPEHLRRTHHKMNPFNVRLRESRDGPSHPSSRAIAVIFDVTGSMGSIPVTLQKKLTKLMGLLAQKGYVDDPQILFGAVGDATCDRAPLQVGQFESGIEMDDDLGRIYLEGGGGGQTTESYELAAYFLARHTAIDCLEKRGEKGYAFIIGDEQYYPRVDRMQVANLIGDSIETDLPTSVIFQELRARYNVYHLLPRGASNSGNDRIRRAWLHLLGQNVIELDDPAAVCETIALCIGLNEGKIDLDMGLADLRDVGVDDRTVRSVSRAIVPSVRVRPARDRSPVRLAIKGLLGMGR